MIAAYCLEHFSGYTCYFIDYYFVFFPDQVTKPKLQTILNVLNFTLKRCTNLKEELFGLSFIRNSSMWKDFILHGVKKNM